MKKATAEASWERVTVNTWRLKVPGGWLYRYQERHTQFQTVPAMVFVTEPEPEAAEILRYQQEAHAAKV